MNRKFYSLDKSGTEAVLSIYGDITSFPVLEGDVSSANLSRQLEQMGDVSAIKVYINSYGGEVAEGLAIYNALKRHPAQVTTFCDGFACSIASVIFMAGDKRVMNEASALMIHNAWSSVEGNAEQLRKLAEDLDVITDQSVKAYLSKVNITEEELRALMDGEKWLSPEEAVEYGFATSIKKDEKADKPSQNARKKVYEMILRNPYQAVDDEEETEEPENPETEEPETDEEPETGTEEEPEEPEDEEAEEAASDEEEEAEEEPEAEDSEDEEDEAMEMQSAFFRAIQHM